MAWNLLRCKRHANRCQIIGMEFALGVLLNTCYAREKRQDGPRINASRIRYKYHIKFERDTSETMRSDDRITDAQCPSVIEFSVSLAWNLL